MLKGTQREIMMINTAGNEFFDAAYFVLRLGAAKGTDDKAIVAEANKIVSQVFGDAIREKKEKRRDKQRGIGLFSVGAIFGGGISLLLCWLVTIL